MMRSEGVRLAVVLAYAGGNAAPQVVAKGRGLFAKAIIERAKAAGIYVHESPELVSLLTQVDLDQHIPAELFIAVAQLLAWIYHLEHGGAPAPRCAEEAAKPGGEITKKVQ